MDDFFAGLNAYAGVLAALACALLAALIVLVLILLARDKKRKEEMLMLDDALRRVDEARQADTQALMQRAADAARDGEERLRGEIIRAQGALSASAAEETRDTTQRIDALGARFDIFGQAQETRLHRISATLDDKLSQNDQKTEKLRESLSQGMEKLQRENAEKLEQMRQTVDEKLHETLNKRLGESFSLVNERLEQVYKGLGEMQTLAGGVGDLKRVLTNVKARGIWGEMQLGALLEQMLSPEQYEANVQVTPRASERVEYAVVLPGREDGNKVYLPIDSKFPAEPYEKVIAAADSGDADALAAAGKELSAAIRTEAKRIQKYIEPPYTTDFAVMFLATEGLYAETLRIRGLMEELQRKNRVVIAGPSTLTALLSSLQLGFRTLAIEKRSAEVWQLLGAVKTEFGRFADILEQTQQRLRQAGESIEKATSKTRTISRRLREVEALGTAQAAALLGSDAEDESALPGE